MNWNNSVKKAKNKIIVRTSFLLISSLLIWKNKFIDIKILLNDIKISEIKSMFHYSIFFFMRNIDSVEIINSFNLILLLNKYKIFRLY